MINKIGQKISLAALLVLSGSTVFADSVVVPGVTTGLWQNWTASQANASGTPYWNQVSWDGPGMNVGGCLTTAKCGISNPPGAIPYLGTANGSAYSNFYFAGTGSPVTATFETQITGAAAYDYLGWYNVANPDQYGVIFSPGTAMGATTTFTPSANYGLFFVNTAPGYNDLYMSQSTTQANSDPGVQHFAVFQQSAGNYWVGAEDLPTPHTDLDYNDMIVKLSSTATPEPDAVLLFGVGAVGLGVFRFRQKKAKA